MILDGAHFVDFVSHMNLPAVLRDLLLVALFYWSSSACNMHGLLHSFSNINDSTHIFVSCVLHMLSSFLYFPMRPSNMLLFFMFLMSCKSISLSVNLFLVLGISIGFSWPPFALLIYAHSLVTKLLLPPVFLAMILCAMLHAHPVPSFFDNPSSLDTSLVSSIDVVSCSNAASSSLSPLA